MLSLIILIIYFNNKIEFYIDFEFNYALDNKKRMINNV